MSEINRFTTISDEAIYDEYTEAYKNYVIHGHKEHAERFIKHFKKLDKAFAKKGEK